MGMRDTGRGAGYTKHFDETLNAGIYDGGIPNIAFIYEVSTTQNPDYAVGDGFRHSDGREFRYAKSAAECYAGQAVQFDNTGFSAWGAIAANQVAGDMEITITGASHDEVGTDELRGGYTFIAGPVTANKEVQFRGIVGNDAAAENANVTIYLDGPLSNTVTAGVNANEVFANPYSAVRLAEGMTTDSRGKPGVAAVYVSAADMYFWIQTRGPMWAGSQNTLLDRDIGGTWKHDGTLEGMSAVVNGTICGAAHTSQYAGYSMIGNNAGNGPLFMLQG